MSRDDSGLVIEILRGTRCGECYGEKYANLDKFNHDRFCPDRPFYYNASVETQCTGRDHYTYMNPEENTRWATRQKLLLKEVCGRE